MSANSPHHSRFFWRSSAMFCILDFDWRFKEVNAAWEKQLGQSTGKLLARPLLEFVHPEDRPEIQYHLEQLAQGTVSIAFSCRFRESNGGYHQLLWEVNAAASSEEAAYAVAMDISERERPSIADEMLGVLHDGVVLQYANGTIGACNASAERIIGLAADQMIGWTLVDPDWNMLREDGTPFPSEGHPAICSLRTGKPYSNVIIGVEKPGSEVIWLNVNAHPLWREEMTPYAVVISFADITDYKLKQDAIRTEARNAPTPEPAEEMQLPSLHAQGDADFWHWNLDSNEVNFSTHWKKMLGYGPQELPNHIDTWFERVHPLDYKKLTAEIEKHLEQQTPQFEVTHRIQHKDGSYRWFMCRGMAVHASGSKPNHVIGMHLEVSEQHRAKEQLQDLESRYKALLDTENDAVLLIDDETDCVVEANKAARQLYGYTQKELIGMARAELSAQVEKNASILRRGKLTRRRHHRRKDGGVFPAEVTSNTFVLLGRPMLMLVVHETSERQELETALWESQSKYRQLFEATSHAIIVFDANSQQIFDVNSHAVDMYGYTPEEFSRLETGALSAEPVKSRAAFYSGGKKQRYIPLRWHKKKDGTVFPVEISTGNSYLFQGRSLVCATLRDITESKAAEEALRKEKEFIDTLVQASPAFFFALNPDGSIRMMNRAMLKALGYNEKDMIGKDFLDIVPLYERAVVSAEFEGLIKSMRPAMLECQILTQDSNTLLVEWHSRAVVQADGSLDFLFGVGIDVTERTKVQSDLRLFKAIIEASEEAIAVSDPDGQLVYINPAHERLFGRSLEDAKTRGRDYYSLAAQERIHSEIMPALHAGRSWSGELDVLDADGGAFPIWERADAIRDAHGKILFEFELMHDISERQRMWETLRSQWEEYELIFNTVPVMIWHRDRENHLLRSNRLANERVDLEQVEHQFFTDNAHVLSTGESEFAAVEVDVSNIRGKRRLQVGKIPYRNRNNEIRGLVVFAIDVTDCNPSGTPGLGCQERLRALLEQAPTPLIAFDSEGSIVAWNTASEQATGYTAHEVLGVRGAPLRLFPDTSQREAMLTSGTGKGIWQNEIVCKDGRKKILSWQRLSDDYPIQGWRTWQLGVEINGSQPVQVNADPNSLIGSLFEHSELGLCITDDRGRFVLVNHAYAAFYGYRPEELHKQPLTLIVPGSRQDQRLRDYFSLMIGNEPPRVLRQTGEYTREGKRFNLLSLMHRVLLPDGRRLLLTLCTDHTEAEF